MNRCLIRSIAVLICASLLGVEPVRAFLLCADGVIQSPIASSHPPVFESEALSLQAGTERHAGQPPNAASDAISEAGHLTDSFVRADTTANPGFGSASVSIPIRNKLRDVTEALASMPYKPDWLDAALMTAIEREMPVLVSIVGHALDEAQPFRSELTTVVQKGYGDFANALDIVHWGPDFSILKDYPHTGRAFWTNVGPWQGDLTHSPILQLSFDGRIIDRQIEDRVKTRINTFLLSHMISVQKRLPRKGYSLGGNDYELTRYLFDVLALIYGVDAILVLEKDPTPLNWLLIKNRHSITDIVMVAGGADAPKDWRDQAAAKRKAAQQSRKGPATDPSWQDLLLAPLDHSLPDNPDQTILSRGSSGGDPEMAIDQLVKLARELGLEFSGKILASVGLGHYARELAVIADKAPEARQFIGVEIIGQHVRQIAVQIENYYPGLRDKIRLYHADARHMDKIDSNSIALLSAVGLVLPEAAATAVEEIVRVLEPGGLTLLYLDLSDMANSIRTIENKRIRAALDFAGEVLSWVGESHLLIHFQKGSVASFKDSLLLRDA